MNRFRIIYFGTAAFACRPLLALHRDLMFEVTCVVTQPDRPAGRGMKLTCSPVKELALSLGIPVAQPEDVLKALSEIRSSTDRPHYLVVVAFGKILEQEWLEYPLIAPLNLHASLLPRWRGASPVQNSILSGDRESGVTIIRMVRDVDAGPILAQKALLIEPRETKMTLEGKLSDMGADLLTETLKAPLREIPQDERKATTCRKLTRSTGRVDPQAMSAEEIDRFVRALVPWPGVRTTVHGHDLKLIETALEPCPDAMELSCLRNTSLYLVKVQPPGKKAMTGSEWERGIRAEH